MPKSKNTIETLGDVLLFVEASALPPYQRRDMRSAINRVAEMAGVMPAMAEATAPALRQMLKKVQAAAHGVSQKTWANLLSGLRAALRLTDVIESRRDGLALKDPGWAPLLEATAEDRRLS